MPDDDDDDSLLSSLRVSKRCALVNGLAFTVGWADVLCLLRYGAFGTMMTGNTMFLAQSVVLARWTLVGFYAAVIGAFCAGQAFYRAVDRVVAKGTSGTSVAPAVLALSFLQDGLGSAFPGRWHVALLSAELGIVCGLANDVDGVVVNMVTGHIQRVANAAFDFAVRDEVRDRQFRQSCAVLFSFFLGVCGGTLATARGRAYRARNAFLPVFSPLGLAFAALLCLHDRHVRERLAHRVVDPSKHWARLVAARLRRSFSHLAPDTLPDAAADDEPSPIADPLITHPRAAGGL